ncbi:SGNH/GDSL hydrolase family protein [Nocardioides sp. Y6]|uniref:SGNH/GDSL hydrolase family protein n=1 Tax=Nocardioides malaquae TaxID=2773426 RepID=A0ABR9RRF5_9ACTN|nr:SGNH/GDSL hydrolase family protein [Nocardioides malaquae]MBE7324149.1 SGNH/GDSL hydrolase family protein [Nocardioides malaquae]
MTPLGKLATALTAGLLSASLLAPPATAGPTAASVTSSVVTSSVATSSTASAKALTPVWDRPGGERMVAFGDSFVAGPLVNPMRLDSGACLRSKGNFPTLVAQTLDVNSFVDASCSGAVVADLYEAQGSNPPQLDALTRDTTLVSFGMLGGNDIGLVGLALGCLTSNCLPAAGTDPLAEEFVELEGDLVQAIADTRARAPRAQILMHGYGTYLPPGGCPQKILGLSSGEADYLQAQINRLSETIEQVAADTGVDFVDHRTIPGIADHTACAAPRDQWIRAVATYFDGAPLHPSAAGMVAAADHVVATLAKTRRTTVEEIRLDALRRKGRSVSMAVSCRLLGSVVRADVDGRGAIDHVELRMDGRAIAVDSKAPWVLRAATKDVRTLAGPVRAVVTLRDDELTVRRNLTAERPRCLA